jgi:hypothetical protein
MTLTLTSSGGVSNAPVSGSPYTIIPSAAVAASGATNFNPANYTITYNTNSLTVNPLPVILTGTQVYNSTTNAYASTLSVSNKVSGDDVSVTNGPGGMASADIGTNTITSLGSLALAGSTSGNYSLAGASGSVIVTPLEVTLIGTRPYDGTNDASSSILTVVTNYDGANLTLASGNAVLASANVGVQPIVSVGTLALGGSADGNYTLTGATLGTVTITNPYNVISNTASLDMSGTNFVVCWASVPGVTYTVLTNSSLNPPVTWTSAGTTTATDTNTCFTLPGGIMSNTNVNVVIQQ